MQSETYSHSGEHPFRAVMRRTAALVLAALLLAAGVLSALTGCTPEDADPWLELIFGRNGYFSIGDDMEGEAHLRLHVIDVGQGDASLVQCGDRNVLIDCGENGLGETVLDYLDRIQVTHLDWVIATHPHSDHIGGMDTVIGSRRITIDRFMMPQVSADLTPTTKTYTDLLAAVKKKKLKITRPVAGQTYDLDGVTMLVLSPAKKARYDDLNDYSVCLKYTYRDVSILLCGDATKVVERQLITLDEDLSAQIYKVSHHGGKESNTEPFLAEVNPLYAAISVGEDNKYGHPTKTVLRRLKEVGCQVNRTDLEGNLLYETDGENISVTMSK